MGVPGAIGAYLVVAEGSAASIASMMGTPKALVAAQIASISWRVTGIESGRCRILAASRQYASRACLRVMRPVRLAMVRVYPGKGSKIHLRRQSTQMAERLAMVYSYFSNIESLSEGSGRAEALRIALVPNITLDVDWRLAPH